MKFHVGIALIHTSVRQVAPLACGLTSTRRKSPSLKRKHYTRATHTESTAEQHKSAITDHVADTNHIINWDNAKIKDRETDRTTKIWLKEAIWIKRKGDQILNRDEGLHTAFHL